MTDLQLAAIISNAMFLGKTYENKILFTEDIDSDEQEYQRFARGMLDVILKNLNVQNRERVIEKSLQDFFAMNGY
tara:strand:+ start:445 stop:669 length:225 start_codon:yes stop_codon:yes gene_type:complete